MHTPFILNTVQRALQATADVMPNKFFLDPDYDLIQFEEGYHKPPREVFYTKYNELLNADKYKVLREQRNKKLTESDFSMLPDYHLSQENEEEWEVYRQALRDLPSTTEDPETPIWPEQPQVKIVQGKNIRTELSDTKSELKADLQTTQTELTEERTLHETTRTQLRTTQTELDVAKIKLLNIEARMQIIESNISKVVV